MTRLVCVLALLGLIAGLLATPALPQTTPATTTIRVASNANDDVTPLLYAQHAGLFAKAGINVEFVHIGSGSAITAAVLGGSVDIGKSNLLTLISAHVRQLPVSLVSPGELWLAGSPISALVTRKTVTVTSAKDLTGKTIAVQALRDFSELALHAWVDQHGGDWSTLKIVEVPQAAILGALSDGRIDGANMSNPGLADVLASGKASIVSRPDDTVGKHYLLTAWFASDAYIASHRALVQRFADVMREATAYTNTHHAETVPLTAPFWGIEPAVLAAMPRAEVAEHLAAVDIQPVIDLAAKYQLIDRAFPARQLISEAVLAPGG